MMDPAIIRRLAEPFFAQSPDPLFVSVCCRRLYVGPTAPTKCRTCPKLPQPIELKSLADIDQVAAQLSP